MHGMLSNFIPDCIFVRFPIRLRFLRKKTDCFLSKTLILIFKEEGNLSLVLNSYKG